MKTTHLALALGLLFAGAAGQPAAAGGTIHNACMSSDRTGASSALCGCIQTVADAMLNGKEQRMGAKFFADPHRSQETRQSKRSSDNAFWTKWKAFGATATQHCS